MLTNQEKRNYLVARAHVEGKPVEKFVDGEQTVTCVFCDGTGITSDSVFPHVPLCNVCNGKGYVSVAKPKPVKYDFSLSQKEKQA